jgi:hypothetical protein
MAVTTKAEDQLCFPLLKLTIRLRHEIKVKIGIETFTKAQSHPF